MTDADVEAGTALTRVELLASAVAGVPIPAAIDDRHLEARVQRGVAASRRKVVALDDDPTGVQTVHNVSVLTRWDPRTLAAELRAPRPLFFILTNSRSLPEREAAALNAEIAGSLLEGSRLSGVPFVIASRSDSTLRGHFPAETNALAHAIGDVDGVILCPAFFEGGRVTVGDVHFIEERDRLVPVAETEFARDATFGYRARTLAEWVAEKSKGRIEPAAVLSLSIDEIRVGGVSHVANRLEILRDAQTLVVNALAYSDLWIVTLALLQTEAAGRRFLYRCGASFVRARAGVSARPLLTRAELLGVDASPLASGLVVVGSHVQRTSEQLARLFELPSATGIEFHVARALDGRSERDREVERVRRRASGTIRSGGIAVVYTSRTHEHRPGRDELSIARGVSDALVAVVQGIEHRPDFVVGKGGITSSDVGTRGLGADRVLVLGQIRPGVPVWRLEEQSRFPGLPYVVFPGNVGGPATLADVVADLAGGAQTGSENAANSAPTET